MMRRALKSFIVLCAASLAPAIGAAATVNFVYLSPSDRAYQPQYSQGIERGISDLRAWFTQQLGGYTLNTSDVAWYQMPNQAAHYQSGPSASFDDLRFWTSVLDDAFSVTGGSFYDSENAWIYYVDADPLPGQRVGGTSGVALLPSNDLRGLAGEPLVPINPGDPSVSPGFSRWVGGLGHELGHALGLHHPTGSPGGPYDYSLMFYGYRTFPETYLRDGEKRHLLESGFFSEPTPVPIPASGFFLTAAICLAGLLRRTRKKVAEHIADLERPTLP